MQNLFFTMLLINFLICTYLNHPKFTYNFLFASTFDTLYLFRIFILLFKVVNRDKDALEHVKIM
jgi:hypothetical protein